MKVRTLAILVLVVTSLARSESVIAQDAEETLAATAQEADSATGRGSFPAAWFGGTLGSLGGGLLLASMAENDCYDCFDALWAFSAGSIIGSTAGAYAGTKLSGGKPSAFAAAVGATLGFFAGLGVASAFSDDDGMLVLSFAATQGVAAALGAGQF